MPRVREIVMDGLSVKIAPLSYDEAEMYIKEGRELLAAEPPTPDDQWAKRTLISVVGALNKAAGKEEWTLDGDATKKKLTKEFDMVFIRRLYDEWLQMSGLVPASGAKGEAPATSTSR